MPAIWLTYAWKDNQNEDVDHVVAQLRGAGLDVKYDPFNCWLGVDCGIKLIRP
jgi:hypothetical protein